VSPYLNFPRRRSEVWRSLTLKFALCIYWVVGHAVAQQLDAGFPLRLPGFAYGQHVGFVVDKAAQGQVFSEYFSFPCQSFHRFLHYHNHSGLTQWAIKCPQCRVDLDSTPPLCKLKKNYIGWCFYILVLVQLKLFEKNISL
jgi:hypothetical protein